jgi:hypothetical protein
MTPQCFTVYKTATQDFNSGTSFSLFNEFKNLITKPDYTIGVDILIFSQQDSKGNIKSLKGLWEFTLQFDIKTTANFPSSSFGQIARYRPNIQTIVNDTLVGERPIFECTGFHEQSSLPMIFQIRLNSENDLFRIDLKPEFYQLSNTSSSIKMAMSNITFSGLKIADLP